MTDYLNKFSLDYKVAFVCGGVGLIGKEVSKALADAGARVVILDIDRQKGARLAEDITNAGYKAQFEFFDITRLEQAEASLKKLIKKYKHVDIWVNASYPRTTDWGKSDFERLTLKSLKKNVDLQLNSVVWTSRIVAQAMQKQRIAGSIIHFGSIYGVQGNDFSIYEGTSIKTPMSYSAIKGGIVNFTRYLAAYLGKDNIRVNTICPGGIFDGQDKRFVKNYERKVPLKRMGRAEEIASVVLFLASSPASYVTGNTMMVDGGWTII